MTKYDFEDMCDNNTFSFISNFYNPANSNTVYLYLKLNWKRLFPKVQMKVA